MKRYALGLIIGVLGSRLPVWLPLVLSGAVLAGAPTLPIVLPVPPGIALHATNPQMIRDGAGVIFAATRASSSIGGVVWRVDGYVDAANPGTASYVLNDPAHPDPRHFWANGELVVWTDGYLYYITVEVDSQNRPINQTAWPVPGWTPQ